MTTDSPDKKAEKAKPKSAKVNAPSNQEGIWETVRTVAFAVLFALLVRTFLYEPFNIPSGSMHPTLKEGDYLFVSKFSYGYSRHSLPFSLPLISGRIFASEPERGDVAVFKLPSDTSTDYIKRIVGLPGDHIQVLSGVLHINGKAVSRRRISDYVSHDKNAGYAPACPLVRHEPHRSVRQYIETLPNAVEHHIIEPCGDVGPLDDTREYIVPAGHYFAMGDNRDNSTDSRVLPSPGRGGVGFIPKENLVGRAEFLFFSTSGYARIWEIWKWPFTIRYERIFNGIN